MSTVSEIIEAVKKLPEQDKSEFLERLGEVDFDDAWDPDGQSRSMKSSATSKFWHTY